MKSTLTLVAVIMTAVMASAGPKTKVKTVPLTDREKKIVSDAHKAFRKAEKLPAPSKHLQEKMQSSIGDASR